MALPDPPVLLITDRQQARGGLLSALTAALAGGVRWVSVREKDLAEEDQVALVSALRPLVHAHGGRLTLHGSAALAREAQADGVHLPADADAGAARALLGPQALIGQSLHSLSEAQAASGLLDYVVAGPAFPTASKPGYGPALEQAGLAALVRACRLPLLALGGIDEAGIPACKAAGCAGIAVMGGLMRTADGAQAARTLLRAWAD